MYCLQIIFAEELAASSSHLKKKKMGTVFTTCRRVCMYDSL